MVQNFVTKVQKWFVKQELNEKESDRIKAVQTCVGEIDPKSQTFSRIHQS